MEAANTAINCCGLQLYNVSQSPEDIKQTYKSILSSAGAWLSPKQRPSAPQRQQRYLRGQAKLQSSAEKPQECNGSLSICSKQSQLRKTKQSSETFQKMMVMVAADFSALHKKPPVDLSLLGPAASPLVSQIITLLYSLSPPSL